MGIRYYAYPIDAADYEAASIDPCPFHGSDPLFDAWGPPDEKPPMLYLDKAWSELQALLGAVDSAPPRPAAALVAGSVTDTGTGWIPHEAALSAEQVRDIAEDLALVGDDDIRELHRHSGYRWANDTPEQAFSYLSAYLADAKEFVSSLANDGRGLVYLIG